MKRSSARAQPVLYTITCGLLVVLFWVILIGVTLASPSRTSELKATIVPPNVKFCECIETLQTHLALEFGEHLMVLGQKRGKGQFGLFYSDHSGSWSMAWIDNDGIACVRMFGTNRKGFFNNII